MGNVSLQHWFDATPAWKCPCNCLTQQSPEIGQGSCWTSEFKLYSCADNGLATLCNSERDTVAVAQLIWQEQVCDNDWGVFMLKCGGLRISGRVVEWFWMAKCNHYCWNCITWCLLWGQDMPTRCWLCVVFVCACACLFWLCFGSL